MAWTDTKVDNVSTIPAAEWNTHVTDQLARPSISSGAGAPSSTPSKVGDIYIDTTNDNSYIAVATTASSDWSSAGSGAATWGSIGGTIADQTDLSDELAVAKSVLYTVGTVADESDYVCDGSADNIQIQAAIDAAYSAGGGIVHMRAGAYNFNAVMTMRTGVILEGEGIGNTVITMATGANCNFFDTEEEDRWTIRDIQFDGNGTNQTSGGWGVFTRGCEYVNIVDVEILNPRSGGIIFSCVDPSGTPGAPSLYCKAQRVRVYNKTGTSTTDLMATQKSSNCGFVDCIAEKTVLSTDNGFGLYGITGGSVITSSQGSYCIGCTAINCQKGFNLEWTNSALLSGCVSTNSNLTGFNVSDAHDCVITGCTSYDDPHGASIDSDSTGIMVVGCSFYNSTTYGIYSKGDHVTIANTIVRDTNNTDGILMEDCAGASINNCTVVDAGKDSSWKSGIQTTRCDSIRIQNNHVYSTDGATTARGIHITGAMNYCLCTGNIVENMADDGIEASDFTYGVIANNILASNGAYGVDWNTGTNTGSEVRDNIYASNTSGSTNP